MKYLLIIVMLITWSSCKESGTNKQNVKESETVSEELLNLPSIPQELVKELYNNCTYTDYIFNELNFSLSQDNVNSVKASIGFISTEIQKTKPQGCNAIGRKFFQVNGEIAIEADVYFSKNCTFYIFFVDGKPAYANKMTQEGYNFYGNIIKQGKKEEEKINNQG